MIRKTLIIFYLIIFNNLLAYCQNESFEMKLNCSHNVLKKEIKGLLKKAELNNIKLILDNEVFEESNFLKSIKFDSIVTKLKGKEGYLFTLSNSGEQFSTETNFILRDSLDDFYIFNNKIKTFELLVKNHEQDFFIKDFFQSLASNVSFKEREIYSQGYLLIEKINFEGNSFSFKTYLYYHLNYYERYIFNELILNKNSYWE